jgi:hypothetical protein
MGNLVRSARGELIDFELLAIKQQLASAPVPKKVEDRKKAIDEKDGVRTSVVPDLDIFALSTEAAETSSQRAKQLKRK